ncbi:hypothetical protein TIFTF001_007261 [Ficus carica]|uniref:Uncharacterized protein n=1 Tax=Ficus carica TaxID=3494 RepID=A0AA87ZPP8_FICCA|nr:hypothetical protein TIFTF001_007261 [Ficus carica]
MYSCGHLMPPAKEFSKTPRPHLPSRHSITDVMLMCKRSIPVVRRLFNGIPSRNVACGRLGALEHGKWVHAYIEKCGMESYIAIGAALVDSVFDKIVSSRSDLMPYHFWLFYVLGYMDV